MSEYFAGKRVLVTGGSGSIGSEVARQLLAAGAAIVRIFSRDETRQAEIAQTFLARDRVRCLLGDVRDRERVRRACEGCDLVIHAAALKHVPACEYDPHEAVLTNVMGTHNVIAAAHDAGVKRLVCISTDKAVDPVNTMGATKLLAERLIAAAHQSMAGIVLCAVRFGNVLGSRGSLLPMVRRQVAAKRAVTITDLRMTRFSMTIQAAVRLALQAAETARGGEVLVLPMPKVRVKDLVAAIVSDECWRRDLDPATVAVQEIGSRPGEKLHERLLTAAELERAALRDDVVVIPPLDAASQPSMRRRLRVADYDSAVGPYLDMDAIATMVSEVTDEAVLC